MLQVRHEVIQAIEQSIVVDARLGLERGSNMCGHPSLSFTADEDTQVVDSQRLQGIEFAFEPLAVAALTRGGEDRCIPEVRADKGGLAGGDGFR